MLLRRGVWDSLASTFACGINNEGHTTYSSSFIAEDKVCRDCGELFFRRAVAIGITKHQRELVSKLSKLSVKKVVDADMSDMPVNDIRQTIAEEIRKALKAPNSNKPQRGTTSCLDNMTSLTNNSQGEVRCGVKRQNHETRPKETTPFEKEVSRPRKRARIEETSEELSLLQASISSTFNVRDVFYISFTILQCKPIYTTEVHTSSEFYGIR